MFDVYISEKRELLVVSCGSKPSVAGQPAKWRKSKKRIKSVSTEIRSAIESRGFYLRRLNAKHGAGSGSEQGLV
ncbi:hypothetical protein [Bradyrhizobium sp. UNPA324]|uniref:hypothetical protein n=1 Tax=Bradyrhizobium sp. UNPA324 TaxID=1141174 RepID=UPI00115359BD|nr:hypothetical protein [Bradyrhizobium sp. UNPA324]